MAKSDQPGSKRAGNRKGSKPKRTTAGTARRTGKPAAPSRRAAVSPEPTLAQVLEQQKATGEILRAIADAPADLESVLQAVALNAARLCDADDAQIYRLQADKLQLAASQGLASAPAEATVNRGWVTGRSIVDRKTIHVHDLAAESEEEYPIAKAMQREHGHHTTLATPLLAPSGALGAILIRRWDVNPFTDAQIDLLETFASQAVIAIENARIVSELETRNQELDDALEQQKAMAELLRVIGSANGELKPVFETLLRNAIRLCEAEFGLLFLKEGDDYSVGAMFGVTDEFRRHMEAGNHRLGRGTATGRAVAAGKSVQIVDLKAETDPEDVEVRKRTVEIGGGRTIFSVPMMQDSQAIGAITIYRREVRPFDEKQIELVSSFASHAVIAVENARLLRELHDRNDELSEALDQQTATAEILRAISTSPTNTQPVFDAIARHAARLCRGQFCNVFRFDGELVHFVAHHGSDQKAEEIISRAFPDTPGMGSAAQRSILKQAVIQIPDIASDPDYRRIDIADYAKFQSVIGVPMMRGDQPIGTITVMRSEAGAFPDRHVELLRTFAEQGVIAIENVRLFTELNARNSDLAETLEQQKATSEILSVISSSPTDAQPVFDTIVRNAVSLCGCLLANVFRYDGEQLHYLASHNIRPGYREMLDETYPMRPDRTQVSGRTILAGSIVYLEDAFADPDYDQRWPTAAGWRSMLGVPMMRDGVPIGALVLGWSEPGPIAEAQVNLIQTFADQAVIAIENVRLFTELNARNSDLRKTLDRQTATAEVLKTISRSTFDLETVLQELAESAVRLCNADHGTIAMKKDGIFYRAINCGLSPEFAKVMQDQQVEIQRGTAVGRALLNGQIVHIPDIERDPDYTFLEAKTVGGLRTILAVPMLREGEAIGVFAVTRQAVDPFTDEQIELVSTFADQAAIAIENVRLYESVESRSQELARSLEELRTTQDRLVQTEKLASLGQLTAGIAHEIKNPLNFVNNFASVSMELLDELLEDVGSAPLDGDGKTAIDELAGMLNGNLAKIAEHGRRADSIVKNMLMHARQGSSEHRPVEINALVDESLNLAYHGARAEKQGFNIEIDRDFDPDIGEADIYPQEITRVILNLVTNGFYAAAKKGETRDGFEPRLTVSTRRIGDRVEIRVRDNGPGIDRETRSKLFSPFFTTKPVGEGTGLGLSISHDIIVKQHGGTIDVDSVPGEYCEFRIEFPRDAAGRTTGAAK